MDPRKILEQLRARAGEIQSELAELRTLDEHDEDQAARFDELLTESDDVLTRIGENETRVARLAEIERAALAGNTEEGAAPNAPVVITGRDDDPYEGLASRMGAAAYGQGRDRAEAQRDLRDRAERRLEVLAGDELSEERAEHAQRALVRLERLGKRRGIVSTHFLLTEADGYRSAFSKLMSDQAALLTEEERHAVAMAQEFRAMSLTDGAGGYLIPFTLDPTVILTNDGAINPMREVARIRTIVTDTWNGAASAGVTASWDAEAAEVSDDAPTITQPSITPHKAAAFVPFSIEAGEDIAGLQEDVTMMFRDAKDRLEAAADATGSGSGQPKGLVTAVAAVTTSRVSATTNNALGTVDVPKVQNDLPARHQPNARWGAHLAIYNTIRQLATDDGFALWGRLGDGTPGALLGKPTLEFFSMDSAIATGDDDVLVYGDFDKYQIVDRVGLSVEYIPHLFATANNRPSGQRGYYAHWRTGADALDTGAFRILRVDRGPDLIESGPESSAGELGPALPIHVATIPPSRSPTTKETRMGHPVIAITSAAVARKKGGGVHQIHKGRTYDSKAAAVKAAPWAFATPDDVAAADLERQAKRRPETQTKAPGAASSAQGPTNAQLRQALVDAGVDVPAKTTKKELQKLLAEHSITVST